MAKKKPDLPKKGETREEHTARLAKKAKVVAPTSIQNPCSEA